MVRVTMTRLITNVLEAGAMDSYPRRATAEKAKAVVQPSLCPLETAAHTVRRVLPGTGISSGNTARVERGVAFGIQIESKKPR